MLEALWKRRANRRSTGMGAADEPGFIGASGFFTLGSKRWLPFRGKRTRPEPENAAALGQQRPKWGARSVRSEFVAPNTCSTRARTFDRVLLPCCSRLVSGRSRCALRWIRLAWGGRRQTAYSRGRNSAQGTMAFSFTHGSLTLMSDPLSLFQATGPPKPAGPSSRPAPRNGSPRRRSPSGPSRSPGHTSESGDSTQIRPNRDIFRGAVLRLFSSLGYPRHAP